MDDLEREAKADLERRMLERRIEAEELAAEEAYEAERKASMEEALAEYPAHKAKQKLEEEQEECPHDELDHGICLSCGRDCFDDLVDRAEWARDAARDDWADRQGQ